MVDLNEERISHPRWICLHFKCGMAANTGARNLNELARNHVRTTGHKVAYGMMRTVELLETIIVKDTDSKSIGA